MYCRFVKRTADVLLSFLGLILLLPLMLLIALVIVIDDPGPVLFTQRRIGKSGSEFRLHKFRSMKMSAPHDVPTHLLRDPGSVITRFGRFLRKSSLDELPQIWDILIGKMSVVGPRPALWNQTDLIEARKDHGAFDVTPGLTGLAQIRGRDELPIEEKARLDGVYAEALKKGGAAALKMDLKCFFGTFLSVLRRDGVVEGGTGAKGDGK